MTPGKRLPFRILVDHPKFSRNGHETVAHPTHNPDVGHQRPTHRPIAPWWGVVPSYSDHNAQTAELCELARDGARMGGCPATLPWP